MSEVARNFWNHAQNKSFIHLFSSAIGSGASIGISALLTVFSVAAVVAGSMGYTAYTYHYSGLPKGIQVAGYDMEGMNRAEATEFLSSALTKLSAPDFSVVLRSEGAEDEPLMFSAEGLGIGYDIVATVDQLFQASQSYSADLIAAGQHGAAPLTYPVIQNKNDIVEVVFEQILHRQRDARVASLSFNEGEWSMVPEQVGLEFSEEAQAQLYEQLMHLGEYLEKGQQEFLVEMTSVPNEVSSEQVSAQMEQFVAQKSRVVRWNLGGVDQALAVVDHQDLFHPVDGQWQVDQAALKSYVDSYADAQESEVGRVNIAEPVEQEKGYLKSAYEGVFSFGVQIDREDFFNKLLGALQSEGTEVQIELVVLQVAPQVEMEGFGRLELLSKGQSSYVLAHSEDRTFNVKKGLGKYDGVVIPQGAEFSFNQILGRVTYEEGWKPALAIFGGGGVQPVPGGGLCQVSTTTYRAAINAGLKITARKPHSLDVSYYHAYGDGIDSTIYPPADIDLRFVNDTPGPIFLHTYTVDDVSEAFVEMYGVSDGRSVELEQVINRPVNLASETVYVPELPAGVQEVVKARAGRYVEWKWVVNYADGSQDVRAIETLYPARRQSIRIGTGG